MAALRKLTQQSGMTVVETLVAMLILGFTTTAVVSLVVTGDRIAGKRAGASYATIIGKNEAEKLRTYETSPLLPGDTSYSAIINGIEFDVSRMRIFGDSISAGTTRPVNGDSVIMYGEYAISITRKSGLPLSVSFRLLQGFYGGQTHQ
jgi:hypothetical protein